MKLFKFLLGAATITVGACAVAGKVRRDKQRQEELDEFLCPDIDEPIEKEIKSNESPLKHMELRHSGTCPTAHHPPDLLCARYRCYDVPSSHGSHTFP